MTKALSTPREYIFKPPPFPELAAILRAAQALKFAIPFEFAARILRQMWPPSLSELTLAPVPHANETIVLAKTCTMPELLKRAYYELLRTGGLGQDEEDSDSEDERMEAIPKRETRIARSDLVLLIKTREHLALEWFFAASSPPQAEAFPCPLDVKNKPLAATERGPDTDEVSTREFTGQQEQQANMEDHPATSDTTKEQCANARAANYIHWDKRVRRSGI